VCAVHGTESVVYGSAQYVHEIDVRAAGSDGNLSNDESIAWRVYVWMLSGQQYAIMPCVDMYADC
jgi:hypothetical protein